MAAARQESVVFFETVLSLRDQKHTFLEAVPLPAALATEVPAYFQQALSEVESEWADHRSVIAFSASRPFQSSMVSRLPYFMIQWDYKGQQGYGHVIEARREDKRRYAPSGRDEAVYEDGDHLGGDGFPSYVYLLILAILHTKFWASCSTCRRRAGGVPSCCLGAPSACRASARSGRPMTGPGRCPSLSFIARDHVPTSSQNYKTRPIWRVVPWVVFFGGGHGLISYPLTLLRHGSRTASPPEAPCRSQLVDAGQALWHVRASPEHWSAQAA